jgi:hypothetical protein
MQVHPDEGVSMVELTAAVSATAVRPGAGSGTRWGYIGVITMMNAIVLVGFWPYYSAFGRGGVETHPLLHLHAAVFTGWMALLMLQAILVHRRDLRAHRKVGAWGLGYGALILVLGLTVTFVAPVQHVLAGEWNLDEAAGFLILPLGDMALFATFFTVAAVHRRNPPLHKRMIVLATIALLFAPAARAGGSPAVILAIWLAPLIIAMVIDRWAHGTVHRAYLIGGAVLLVAFTRIFLIEAELWLRVGRSLLTPFLSAVPHV